MFQFRYENVRLASPAVFAAGIACLFAVPLHGQSVASVTNSGYRIRADQPQQVIKGFGFEIQSDSIGSGNAGMPDEVVAVPHDLTPSERARFYHEMLHGFRYARLALGLYLRGTDSEQKHITERYPGQMHELSEMQRESGIEGFDVEYWSPTPFWKKNGTYYGGTIASDTSSFVDSFSTAMAQDLQYLKSHGLSVAMWGLQNEPQVDLANAAKSPNADAQKRQSYATCFYTPSDYAKVLKATIPKVRSVFPNTMIHAPSGDGNVGPFADEIRKDPALLKGLDAWTWHQAGRDSNMQIERQAYYMQGADGKAVFQNEFEYQPWGAIKLDAYFMNTGQSLMNWLVFENSPTWFWIHALKPATNLEAKGYALGFWQPLIPSARSRETNLAPGHWEFNPYNWNAVAGFVKYIKWDSTRLSVDEDAVLHDQRILAWKTKKGKLGIAVSNRGDIPFTFHIDTSRTAGWSGHSYTVTTRDRFLGTKPAGAQLVLTVQPKSFEFWTER